MLLIIKEKTEYFINLGLKSNKDVKKAKRYYKGFKKVIINIFLIAFS
jgi:hypothetical protein